MRYRLFIALLVLGSALLPSWTWAGGAQQTTIGGLPLIWPGKLIYNLDRGPLKSGNSNFESSSLSAVVENAFATWTENLPVGQLKITAGEELPLSSDNVGDDVNESNFDQYLGNGRPVNPIIWDEDGAILDAILGSCSSSSVLAFAGIERYDAKTGFIDKARAVFSGACFPDAQGLTQTPPGCPPCLRPRTESELQTIVLHELGHFLGMDHSQVNPLSYKACLQAEECPFNQAEDIPSMFPKLVLGASMETLHADDIAYFRRLYQDPRLDTCAVSGSVQSQEGHPLRGVEVVARPLDQKTAATEALAFVSGAEAPRYEEFNGNADNCKEGCGDYLITGLEPGRSYILCAQKIIPDFSGGAGIEPVNQPVGGFADHCFEEKVITCDCPSGDHCPEYPDQDLTIEINLQDSPSLLANGAMEASGGCSLMKPRLSIWPALRKAGILACLLP